LVNVRGMGVLSPRTETYSWEPPGGRPLEFARSQHGCSLGASLLLIALKLAQRSNVISSGRILASYELLIVDELGFVQNLQQTARHSSPAQSGTCAEVSQDKQAALSLSSEMGSVDVLRQRSGS
jgi:hypothetical protein